MPETARVRTRLLPTLLALSLVATFGCLPKVVAIVAPSTVRAGETFEVQVSLQWVGGGHDDRSRGGLVLQLPSNVRIVGWGTSSAAPAPRYNEPALMKLYKAAPGMKLHGFSAEQKNDSSFTAGIVRIQMWAPPGTIVMKAAAAAQNPASWELTSPAGVGDFAKITAANHQATVNVTSNVPVATFATANRGLPIDGGFHRAVFADIDHDGQDDLACSGPPKWPVVFRNTAALGTSPRLESHRGPSDEARPPRRDRTW